MEQLELIYQSLVNIRTYLVKIGPSRRQGQVLENKVIEAKNLIKEYKNVLCLLENSISKAVYSEDSELISQFSQKIDRLYNEILSFSICNTSSIVKSDTMDKFNFKTAASLVPVMDGSNDSVEKIIQGIEMYSSFLNAESKAHLITYVLKTRLTKSAKLKLKLSYESCDALISDMKQYLLPKISANSLLSQLNNVSQNEMTISQYADKIEDLFVNLTISQANSNETACKILRPINEQMAIKKFADGLRNRRLSMIIAARDYSNFKDAVRAAADEELTCPNSSNTILNVRGKSRNNYYRPSNRSWRTSNQRGGYNQRGGRNQQSQGGYQYQGRGVHQYQGQGYQYQRGQNNRVRNTHGNFVRSSRGRVNFSRPPQRSIFTAGTSQQVEPQEITGEHLNQFFRD